MKSNLCSVYCLQALSSHFIIMIQYKSKAKDNQWEWNFRNKICEVHVLFCQNNEGCDRKTFRKIRLSNFYDMHHMEYTSPFQGLEFR